MRTVIAAALRRAANRLAPQPIVVHVKIDQEEIIKAIRVRNKRMGVKSAGI